MTAERFYLSGHPTPGEIYTLDPGEAHHIARVLRKSPGSVIGWFNGEGRSGTARIIAVKPDIRIEVETARQMSRTPPEIVLAIAIPKKAAVFESVLRGATELGVWTIQPLFSDRCLAGTRARDRMERWRKILVSACKQCGQVWIPRVPDPIALQTFIETTRDTGTFCAVGCEPGIAHPETAGVPADISGIETLVWLVGPEGGWSPGEMALFRRTPTCRPVCLGQFTWTVQTAAVAGLAMMLAHFGLSGFPPG